MVGPVVAGAGTPERRRRRRSGALRALPWIAPALCVLLFVFGYGTWRLLEAATHREGRFIGLENIRIVLRDPLWRTAIGHNLRLLLALPVIIALALLLAILLFEGLRGWRFHRFTIFLPYVLPIPVVGVVFSQILTRNGVLNTGLHSLGLDFLAHDWLGQPRFALWSVGGVIIWKELGFGVILFLARLLSLPTDVFEAARVDGAGFWRLHTRITIPMLMPIIGFYIVVESITLVSWVFNYVFTLTGGGPGDSTQVAETYIYSNATQYNAPWLAASAAATMLVGVVALMIVMAIVRTRLERIERRR